MDREVESFSSLEDMVLKVMGNEAKGKLITKTAVIFEYIDSSGKLDQSLIHPSYVSQMESIELVASLFHKSIERNIDLGSLFDDMEDPDDDEPTDK